MTSAAFEAVAVLDASLGPVPAVYPDLAHDPAQGKAMPLHVLVLDDDPLLRRAITRHLTKRGIGVVAAGTVAEALAALDGGRAVDALVLDVWLPDGRGLDVLERLPRGMRRPPTIVMTGEASVETAVGALRVGAIDYLLKPFSNEALDEALSRVVSVGDARAALGGADRKGALEWARRHVPEVIGEHPSLLDVFDVLRRVADTDCAILIQGETGTGKELIARAIHAANRRSSGALVAVNCAAVPEQLIESELFGHARGAFTGATAARVGRFEEAHGGTIFLDEVGDMPLLVQAKLLRVLQEKEVAPLGTAKRIKVDVRVIAATHRDLEAAVAEGTFREDLFYRLDVIRVELPPLRARPEDIPLLVNHFVRETNARRGTQVTGVEPAAMQLLGSLPWPGNVRQLRNIVERMVLLRQTGTVVTSDVPEKLRAERKAEAASGEEWATPVLPEGGIDLFDAVERFETSLIRQALDRAGWNKNRAAEILRIKRTTLVEKLKKRQRLEAKPPSAPPTLDEPPDEERGS